MIETYDDLLIEMRTHSVTKSGLETALTVLSGSPYRLSAIKVYDTKHGRLSATQKALFNLIFSGHIQNFEDIGRVKQRKRHQS